MSHVSIYLKKRRRELNMTQAEVAKALHYESPQFISNIERGVSALPDDAFRAVCNLYTIYPVFLIELALKDREAELIKKMKV